MRATSADVHESGSVRSGGQAVILEPAPEEDQGQYEALE